MKLSELHEGTGSDLFAFIDYVEKVIPEEHEGLQRDLKKLGAKLFKEGWQMRHSLVAAKNRSAASSGKSQIRTELVWFNKTIDDGVVEITMPNPHLTSSITYVRITYLKGGYRVSTNEVLVDDLLDSFNDWIEHARNGNAT